MGYKVTNIVQKITNIVQKVTNIMYKVRNIVYKVRNIVYKVRNIVYKVTNIVQIAIPHSNISNITLQSISNTFKFTQIRSNPFEQVHSGSFRFKQDYSRTNKIIQERLSCELKRFSCESKRHSCESNKCLN